MPLFRCTRWKRCRHCFRLQFTAKLPRFGVQADSLVFADEEDHKGKLWSQILADVTGLTVHVPVVEATAVRVRYCREALAWVSVSLAGNGRKALVRAGIGA